MASASTSNKTPPTTGRIFDRRATKTQTSSGQRPVSVGSVTIKAEGDVEKHIAATLEGRQTTIIVRKKLPWLDGPQQSYQRRIPGQFDQEEHPEPGDEDTSPSPEAERYARAEPSTPLKKNSVSSVNGDLTLRATGSTPSLRKRARSGDFKSLSLNSKPRSGIRPVKTIREARQVLGAVDERPKTAGYASSDYSVTPSSEIDAMPATLPKKDPSSYERLVNRCVSARLESREPFHVSNHWLQSTLDLPLEPETSPGHKIQSHRSSRSCRSCETPIEAYIPSNPYEMQVEPSPVLAMPKAKTLPRRPVAPLPSKSPPPPPPRQSTLYAMPTHLLPSSSSSSSSASPRAPVAVPQPSVPSPVFSNTRDVRHQSQSLNRTVTGLESLVEEARHVARKAAGRERNDEVANILDNATVALRKASTVQTQMRGGRMSQPLVLSPAASERGSESDSSIGPDSDVSSAHSRGASIETAPTILTRSAQSSQQPLFVDPYKLGGRAPASLKASVEDARDRKQDLPDDERSMSHTPPRLYQPPSADSIVRDFAYANMTTAKAERARALSKAASWGAAADYYGDNGQSIRFQPGVRPSINPPMITEKSLPDLPGALHRRSRVPSNLRTRAATEMEPAHGPHEHIPVRRMKPEPTKASFSPQKKVSKYDAGNSGEDEPCCSRNRRRRRRHHLSDLFESAYYRQHGQGVERGLDPNLATYSPANVPERGDSLVTDTRYAPSSSELYKRRSSSKSSTRYSGPTTLLHRDISLRHPRRKHISLREGQGFSLGRYHRRAPIAREWTTFRKRIAATIACLNTVFIGLIAGIYAGEVPRMQYQLADTTHKVILGNVLLFACLGVTTLIFWPLPLLHGRKPYTLLGMALMLPLLFPQALAVSGFRTPNTPLYRCGLLIPRAFNGIAMGFANINFLPTLFDLFGASLMSDKPHQEIVVYDDVRRQGGGIGVWLGIWSFCFVGSMSIGFCVGACIISKLDPSWGFYIVVILLAFFLLVNVIAPETRRSPYRRSIAQFLEGEDGDERVKRRVARGEVRLHISNDGPKWWFQEAWAGIILMKRMVFQAGFFILMLYLAWMYAQVTLVILLLGALLSRYYLWQPQYVGAAVLSMAIGAALALPLSKANLFSRSRDHPQRTDSMTMRHSRVTWTSHMLRRCIFTLTLPFAAIAFALSSPGPSISWTTPTIFCGLVGFLSNLAIAECVGLIMETFDTCDLQPGVNQKHRLQSMAEATRRRRTNYSAFPRVCAGFFAAQGLGFLLSAAATGVSGDVTRAVGAQTATAIVAGILLVLTVLFIIVLWRWKEFQVVPNNAFGTGKGPIDWGPGATDPEWKPVIIGNPSGKMRRMNLLEMGGLSRWTEIRKLNKLVRH